MIPKVIHYCWFGRNPLPELAVKCIESWKKYLPDYEIKEWNEDNFDVNSIQYTKEAYEAKKYAFVSDYARFKILKEYGGLYFDTDVEVIKSLYPIIADGPFMGCEEICDLSNKKLICINPGLGLAAEPNMQIYDEILDYYSKLSFVLPNKSYNLATVVQYTTEILLRHNLQCVNSIQEVMGIKIYPKEYFCPLDYTTKVLKITDKTFTIHHYSDSWHTGRHRLFRKIAKVIGMDSAHKLASLLKDLHIIK